MEPPASVAARQAIFRVHTRAMPLSESVDLALLAGRSGGLSGAEIAGVCREAAMAALREQHARGGGASLATRSVLGYWVGVRRLSHLSLFLTAYRMVLPKILVLTPRCAGPVACSGGRGAGVVSMAHFLAAMPESARAEGPSAEQPEQPAVSSDTDDDDL